MASVHANDLNYGHFGAPEYHVDNASWSFARTPGRQGLFHLLGSWKLVQDTEFLTPHAFAAQETSTTRDIQNAVEALLQREPDLAPSGDLLTDLGRTSSAITGATRVYDPAIGDQISFGSFAYEGRYRYPRRIAAVPAGEARNILHIVVLSKERQGWGSDRQSWLEGPSLRAFRSGYWADIAAPIQQLCFASGGHRSTFLAVRYPTQTVVFRPISRKFPQSANPSRFYRLPPTTVDPCYLFSVSLEQTGGNVHAHVAFNPEYQRQVALVDIKGNWGVWDIEGGSRKKPKYYLSCAAAGAVSRRQSEDDTGSPITEDGWARIMWVGDVNTLFVSTRRDAQVFDISDRQTTVLHCTTVVPQRSTDWILDVRSHPTNKHRFFVLTSTRLHLMCVVCKNDRINEGEGPPGARILLSWTHFRGTEDITLQIYVPVLPDDETVVLLYSRLNSLITTYQFQDTESESPRPFSSADPSPLLLDELAQVGNIRLNISNLHLERLQYRLDEQSQHESVASRYIQQDIKFYRLSVVLSDGCVRQILLYRHPPSTSEAKIPIEVPKWSKRLASRVALSEAFIDEDDEFIEPNEASSNLLPEPSLPSHEATYFPVHNSDSEYNNTSSRFSTSDYQFVYDTLIHSGHVSAHPENPNTHREDVSAVLDQVEDVLAQDPEKAEIPRGLLLDLVRTSLDVSNIDRASTQLQDLVDMANGEAQTSVKLRWLGSVQSLQLGDADDAGHPSMSSLYDSILESWVASLPESISERVRGVKERLARRIAAEVILSSMRLTVAGFKEPSTNSQTSSARDEGAPSSPLVPPSRLQTMSSQAEIPSSQSRSSQPSTSYNPITEQLNPVTRLSQHIQISKPPPEIPSKINQVLMHWTLGTDPKTYDWNATTRAIDLQFNVDSDDEASQKEREAQNAADRKAERLRKRHRREADKARRNAESQPLFGRDYAGARSSPAPAVGMSSQTQMQSQTQSQGPISGAGVGFPIVQSQVEPGRHGGRHEIKKKKKVRVRGF